MPFLAAAFFAASAVAAAATPAPAPGPVRGFATLVLNGVNSGNVFIAVNGTDILVRIADFARAGVAVRGGARLTIAGSDYVSLASLAPTFTYSFDQHTLVLAVTVSSAAAFLPRTLDLAPQAPENVQYVADRGVFLNYSLGYSPGSHPAAFFENGIDLPHALVLNTVQFDGKSFLRELDQLIFDDRARLRRTTFGDALISTGALGGGAILGGIVVQREFSLNPYTVIFPTASIQGQVLYPSTAEVYVNGQLVRTVPLQPGQFTLAGIPLQAGTSNVNVLIRTPFGIQHVTEELTSAAGVLRPGLSDYAYGVGAVRNGNAYAPVAILGRYLVGVTSRLTIGGRFEASPGLVSGGLNATTILGPLALAFAGAASESQGLAGTAASLQVGVPTRSRVGISAFAEWQSIHYATIGLSPSRPRQTSNIGATLAANLSPTTTFTASLQNAIDSAQGPLRQSTFQLAQQIGAKTQLQLALVRTRGTSPLFGPVSSNAFSVDLLRTIGRSGEISVSHSDVTAPTGDSHSFSISASRSPAGAYGLAYNAGLSLTPVKTGSLALQYQGPAANASLLLSGGQGAFGADFNFSGAVAYGGDHLFLTRPISDAFAVVTAPGLGGADVYSNGRYEGKTGHSGFAILTDVTSEVPNTINVLLPRGILNATISGPSVPIVPNFRGAAVVKYQVQRIRAIVGTLILRRKNGSSVVPMYGQFTLSANGKNQQSEIDQNGRFYINGISAGRYPALVEFNNESCRFFVSVPATDRPFLNLGSLPCTES